MGFLPHPAAALLLLALAGVAAAQDAAPAPAPAPSGPHVETLVCLRHAERLLNGQAGGHDYGQLTVQGLNRSLALPQVLLGKYGKPQFLFAPNPAQPIRSPDGSLYCYVRPLATIEPTAILCQLPVDTRFGYGSIDALEAEVRKPAYQDATVFVCWEHAFVERFARNLVKDLGGDPAQVPVWDMGKMGYDALYVVKVTVQDGQTSVAFSLDHEGLDHSSDTFPAPPAP